MAVNKHQVRAKPEPATKKAAAPRRGAPDPTSPAGMGLADIRVELAETHGVNMNTTREMNVDKCREILIQSRLTRDDEARRGVPNPHVKGAEVDESLVEEVAEFHATYAGPKSLTALADGTCKHGEDPVLCEACEDEMLGEDDGEDDFDTSPQIEAARVAAGIDDEDPEYTEVPGARVVRQPTLTEQAAALGDDPAKTGEGTNPETWGDYDTSEDDDWFDEALTEQDEAKAAAPPALFMGMPGVLDYSFSGHAGTGPSGADRWMNCTASLGMSRRFLSNLSDNQQAEFATGNMAARQGTTAHAAAEVEARVMLGELDANEAEHELFELAIDPPAGEDYTPEMAVFITEYTDLVKSFVDDGYEVLIEERVLAAVPLSAPLPLETLAALGLDEGDDFYVIPGSVDCGVLPVEDEDHEQVITAIDLKYGEGKDVDPDSNPQIRIYMLGLLARFIERGGDIETLKRLDYIIAQPRLGGIKSWTESVDDLLTWQDEVLTPALTAALGLAPSAFSPGESTCQWCPARGGCSALADARVSAATELFTALDDAEFGDGPALVAADLDNDRLASLLKQITGLTDLQADLKAEAQRRMYRGDKIPGMGLYNYTPPRHWADGAEAFFQDEDNEALPAWNPPTLRTPTQFVKALSAEVKGKNAKEREAAVQKRFSRLIVVPEKRPVVGFDGDKRTPWQGKAPDEMFEVIED